MHSSRFHSMTNKPRQLSIFLQRNWRRQQKRPYPWIVKRRTEDRNLQCCRYNRKDRRETHMLLLGSDLLYIYEQYFKKVAHHHLAAKQCIIIIMRANSIIFIILLTFAVIKANPFDREVRSGGFPKFPMSRIGLQQCGNRLVSHHAQRSSSSAIAKIVGGSTAPYGAYPWQVEIQAWRSGSRRWEHHCGGAVVGDRLVLTAAHCIANLDYPDKMRLVLGKVNLAARDRYERVYKPEKIVVHPEFRKDGPHSNDIAVIKVRASSEGGIHFNSHVQPICLPDPVSQRVATGDWCTVTGWGAQSQDDLESLSEELQAASVPVLDLQTCRQQDVYGGRDQSILDSMVCAGVLAGGVDACGGDSGGPLACQLQGRFVLAGLVSWGDGCAKKNRPGVYTRVSHYTGWIEETMQKMGL